MKTVSESPLDHPSSAPTRPPISPADLHFPSGAISLDSSFYIERLPLENHAYQGIEKPGGLVRIQAPQGMGKSSLLLRLTAHARVQGYQTVTINLQTADQDIFTSIGKFLRWFCASVTYQLRKPSCLDDYWDNDIGAKLSCTMYFEDYLLAELDTPLVIALQHVEEIFEHVAIAVDFLPLLRFWHEQAKQGDVFRHLRLLVSHSTEVYVPLNINHSPFNVGLPIRLPPFNLAQVKALAYAYGLDWESDREVQQLMDLVGGRPALVNMALYDISYGKKTLDQFLHEAPTQTSIYRHHLQKLLTTLNHQPELAAALKDVVSSMSGVELEPVIAYKLNSLGLVELRGNECLTSCELYRKFFVHKTFSQLDAWRERLAQLEEENTQLKQLVNLDALTQVANRRSFDEFIQAKWQQLVEMQAPLAVILADVDCFKFYNDTYGHQAGDQCLQQVAQAMQKCAQRTSDLVARYGGEEFVVVLPLTTAESAAQMAETMLNCIKEKKISHDRSTVAAKIVTVSMGVASVIPTLDQDPTSLIKAADQALYQAKALGRDRVQIAIAAD